MPQDILDRLRSALSDRFLVDRQLGSGGMALVYVAEELRHGRTVAIKVIRPDVAESVGTDRFLREIRLTAGLTHPNIPPLLDSGEADGLLYFVMPLMGGATLRRRLDDEPRVGIKEALTLTRDIAEALEYAHGMGVVHRDVKPSNVFLEGGHALLGDFGIALSEGGDSFATTSADAVFGTVEYMSPEQCSGSHNVDGRSDIYSLGCVLYEMLGGEPPFIARSRIAIIARHISEPAPSLLTLRGDLPSRVEEIVRTCLAKAPGDRYASARDLRGALDAALLDPQGRAANRRPLRLAWRTVAVAVGLVGVVVASILTFLRPTEATALDAERVVVFPLADRGGGVPVGADVAIMIGNALVHNEPLRWIDGWEMLSPEHRRDPNLLGAVEARAIAMDRGARFYLTGGVALAGDSISVRLVLHDAAGDSILRQAVAAGAAAEVTPDRLGLRAVVQLLPDLVDPTRVIDVSYLTERDPGAVALWIAGDRQYRQARFLDALESYRGAVEADSFLAMAALKGAQAASWSERVEDSEDLLRLGMRHDSVLPVRHRAFAAGLAAYSAGDASDAVGHFQTALGFDPAWSEALTAMGEVYWHLLPPDLGGADSAAAFFERAVLEDPEFSPPLVHLVEEAFRRGRHADGTALIERLQRARGEPLASLDWLELMEDCVAPGGDPVGRFVASGTNTTQLLFASRVYATGGARWDCAEAGFAEVLQRPGPTAGERWVAIMGLQGILTAAGRDRELADLLRNARSETPSTNFLFALDVLAGADVVEQARAVDGEAAANWGPGFEAIGPLTAWALAVWNAQERDLPTLERLAARMEALGAERNDVEILVQAVRGHRALAEGDSARAVEIFRSLESSGSRVGLETGLWEPLAAERILLAELLLARGDHEEAYRVASIFDHPEPLIFVPFLARSLSIRVQAAQALAGAEWEQRARESSARLESLGRTDLMGSPDQSP